MLEIGSLVDGKYRILDEVGRGGMSIVYLARNIRTNKQWAIKEVRKDGTNDYDIVRSNLIAETDILKKLDHPNLPNIIDILDDGDSFIIIMDFIEGNSLQHYLKYSGAQPEEDVVQWSKQLCDVLGYLHSRTPPIIYRDMKPANVMLKPDGNVSLIDFGTAREYKETSVEDTKCLGTQGYAAPEQYGGHGQTDARTDIYCLGATMYHLVTGHNPAEPPYEMYPIRYWNPNLSMGLEQIILKCTQKNPEDRYQSCEELMYALEHREQLDEGVIQRQKRYLAVFLLSLIMTLLFTGGFFGFGAAEDATLAQTYETKVSNAEKDIGNGDYESAMENYQWAAEHDAGRKDAYESALRELKNDRGEEDFSSEDARKIQTLLKGSSSEQYSNESVFKDEDPEGYAEFCYRLGTAYMLSMKSGGACSNAEGYLFNAKESPYITGSQKTIAETLYDMCVLYRVKDYDLATDDMSQVEKTFDQYWNEMYALGMSENLSEDVFGSERMEIEFYRFVVARITDTTKKFSDAGVDPQEMENLVDKAAQRLAGLNADDDTIDFNGARERIESVQNKSKSGGGSAQ